jgi:c-di-AMP phosphodiesterase-like protein
MVSCCKLYLQSICYIVFVTVNLLSQTKFLLDMQLQYLKNLEHRSNLVSTFTRNLKQEPLGILNYNRHCKRNQLDIVLKQQITNSHYNSFQLCRMFLYHQCRKILLDKYLHTI